MTTPGNILRSILAIPPFSSLNHNSSRTLLSLLSNRAQGRRRQDDHLTPIPTLPLVRMSSLSASTTPPQQKEWLVLLPDHPNALSKRLSVRAQHLNGVAPGLASGQVLLGGATLSKHPDRDEPPDMTGSVMLVTAESEEEVRRFVAEDVYTKSGVWDMERVTIWPFRTAVRKGVEVGGKVW